MRVEQQPVTGTVRTRIEQSANGLEATFIGEMLKIAMPDMSSGAFGGGVGESQFGSFLTERYADALAERLDLGLAGRMGRTDA